MRHFVLAAAICILTGLSAAHAQSMPGGALDAESQFARALAVDAGHVFVGEAAHLHVPGLVYVFHQEEDGDWTELSRLQADDGDVGNRFGTAIAAHGGAALVGAPETEPFGAAYLFERDDEGAWVQTARLVPDDTTAAFGSSVAIGEDVLVVGANEDGDETGRVFIYEREGDDWMLTETLRGDGTEAGDRFGTTLAFSGNHLMVASPGMDAGTIFAYRYDEAEDEWQSLGTLSTGVLESGNQLGTALHLYDGKLLAGAPGYGRTGLVMTYQYEEGEDAWRTTGQLLPFDGGAPQRFGSAITFDGTSVWIGAPMAEGRQGVIYRYTQDEETGAWTGATREIPPLDIPRAGMFGVPMASHDGLVLVGLPGANQGAGLAAIYRSDTGEWAEAYLESNPDIGLASITGGEAICDDGAVDVFDCQDIDLLSFLPIREIGGTRGTATNDVWGWTDPELGREIALVGRTDGLAFVDVTDPANPVFLGDQPLTEGARPSSWRDTKVYGNYSVTVADNAGAHGMQIFDLTQLRDLYDTDEPVSFEPTVLYTNINSAHNVHVDEDTGYAYIVGASGGGETCGGGLHIVNIEDPLNPEFKGCFADERTGRSGTGYTHDVQCVIYDGPDERYQGREICFGSNENAISISDVTEKDNPVALSIGTYPNYGYVHQGWLTEDMHYFYVNDELDELNGLVDNTRTLIWDVSDLEDPQLVEEFFHETTATTHNLYIRGNLMYQSNYRAGLRVLDISDPLNPEVVGYFDTAPYQEGPGFSGSWSNFPFFESGTILVNSMQEGIFMVRPRVDAPTL